MRLRKEPPVEDKSATISNIPPIHPMNDAPAQAQGGAPTQLFLGDIDEEKRLSIARFRFDEYFERDGWKKDWGGVELDGLESVYKTISLKLKELWELAGHIAHLEGHYKPEKVVREYLIKLEQMMPEEQSSYLIAVCAMLYDKHNLGLKHGYKSEWDQLASGDSGDSDDGGDTDHFKDAEPG